MPSEKLFDYVIPTRPRHNILTRPRGYKYQLERLMLFRVVGVVAMVFIVMHICTMFHIAFFPQTVMVGVLGLLLVFVEQNDCCIGFYI